MHAEWNLETILALVAAIAAVVSPILTALIQTRNAYKIKAAEMFFSAKSDAYKRYLHCATEIKASPGGEATVELMDATAQAQLFSALDTQMKIGLYSKDLLDFDTGEVPMSRLAASSTEAMFAMREELHRPHRIQKLRSSREPLQSGKP